MYINTLEKNPAATIKKLTALWALSEALLGGILHSMKIPLTGLVIGGVAAIIIIQIGHLRATRKTIIKATLVVILVKMILSPYTPFNAYFAVFIQGLTGSIIFSSKRLFKVRSLLFAMMVLTFSALQRILVLTLIYGKNLWEAIDIFVAIIIKQLGIHDTNSINFSMFIIQGYIGVHIVIGLLIGWWSIGLLERLNRYILPEDMIFASGNIKSIKKEKRKWWKKPGIIIIFGMSVFLYVFSIIDPSMEGEISAKPVILIIRSIVILIIWFYWLGPLLRKLAKYLLAKRESEFKNEIHDTLALIPSLKILAYNCWKYSEKRPFLKRIWDFIHRLPANLLLHDNIGEKFE